MKISILAAVASNHVIGRDNTLIWRLPADLKHFKSLTKGHTIIMGRKTYRSIGKPLPDRTNIVISKQINLSIPGAHVVHSIDEALKSAKDGGENHIFIIGGGNLYLQCMDIADDLYITEVHEEFSGDTFFPPINMDIWNEVHRESHPIDLKHAHRYSFVHYQRK